MERMTQLREALLDVYAEIDLQSLLRKIAELIQSHLDCEESSIFLYDSAAEELQFEIVTGASAQELKKVTLRLGEGVAGWIAARQQSVIINDCAQDSRFTSQTDDKTQFTTRTLAGVPVMLESKLLGVLEAVNHRKGRFQQDDLRLLEQIARFVAIPLQNALLFRKIRQETREKSRLLELARIISRSTGMEEMFQALKDMICDVIEPTQLQVMVDSHDRLYDLIENEDKNEPREAVDSTRIAGEMAQFPLRVSDRTIGYLQVQVAGRLQQETASLIKGIAVFAAIVIEKLELFSQKLAKEKIEKELQIAREIQQSFLKKDPVDVPGYDITYVNIPSSAVGGDYYEIRDFGASETVISLNDVSGHGIPASLLMSVFRTNFVYRIQKDRDLKTTIRHLNDLISETTGTNLYVTSFTGVLNRENHELRYINAGHKPPLFLRGSEMIPLADGDLVLGMFAGTEFSVSRTSLQRGDLLCLYTDGIVEAENGAGREFGESALIELLQRHRGQSCREIQQKIITTLTEFCAPAAFNDDVTFVLIKRT